MTDTDDRDPRGRFTRGNKAGKGNPHLARLADAQAEMRAAVRPGDVEAVLRKLHELALAGDTHAARIYLDRVLGRAETPPIELHHVALGDAPIGPPVPSDTDLLAGIARLTELSRELLHDNGPGAGPPADDGSVPATEPRRNGHIRKP